MPDQHPAAQRARKRLQALGIDPDTMDREQIRAAYESWRAAYIEVATAGRHMERITRDGDPLSGACLHARYGMLTDSIKDLYGEHPAGWSHPRIAWPGPGERATTITVTQAAAADAVPDIRTRVTEQLLP